MTTPQPTETKYRLKVTSNKGEDRGYVKHIEFARRWSGGRTYAEFTTDVIDAKLFGDRTAKRAQTALYVSGGNRTALEPVTVIVEKAPQASKQMIDATKEVFESILQQMKDNARQSVRRHYERVRDRVAKTHNREELRKEFSSRLDFHDISIASKMVENVNPHDYMMNAPHQLKANLDSLITKWVEEDVKRMFESFIAKQTAKVAAVVKDRNVSCAAQIMGNLEGEFRFKLSDGSKFTMRTKIVWKTSINGLLFWQFPSTFHDAVKADGSKVKTPSELKLKKEF